MKTKSKPNYTTLSDEQLVNMIATCPYDDEAAVYLLFERYKPLLMALFFSFNTKGDWFNDCINDLYLRLKGPNMDFRPLASIEWRSTFGTWLKKVVVREFPKTIKRMEMTVKHGSYMESMDDEKQAGKNKCVGGMEDENHRLQLVLFLEDINQLKNEDQKFVIRKRLEGYRSKEIAAMLKQKWQMNGIVKFNNKGKKVIANERYVNSCIQHARQNLKHLFFKGRDHNG